MENKSVEVEDTGVAPDGQGCLYGMDSKLVDMQNAFDGRNGLECLAEMENKSVEVEDAGVGPNGQRCLDILENNSVGVEDADVGPNGLECLAGMENKSVEVEDAGFGPNGQRCLDSLENKCGEVEDGNDELIVPTHTTGIKRKAFQIVDIAAKPDFLSLRFTIFDVRRHMSILLILRLIPGKSLYY